MSNDKKELGITKGIWSLAKRSDEERTFGNIYSSEANLAICVLKKDSYRSLEEAEANALIIADAGTVANETGKTPRQLAEENKMLLNNGKNFLAWVRMHSSFKYSNHPFIEDFEVAIAKAEGSGE